MRQRLPERVRALFSSRLTGLWRDPDFLKFWAGQTVSEFGTRVTSLALPLTAVALLGATPSQMGIMRAAGGLPFLALGLLAGVWVDRSRRKSILMVANLGRALVLGSVPLAAVAGLLCIEQLYAVSLFTGILAVFFDIAYMSYLPSLIERSRLVEGNAKLTSTGAIASVAGPGAAGYLVQIIGAPLSIIADAFSYLVSWFSLWLIRAPEAAPETRSAGRNLRREIIEGMRTLLGDPILRPIAASTATNNFFSGIQGTVYVLFLVNELGLQPAAMGAAFAGMGIGSLIGAAVAGKIGRVLGVGPALVLLPPLLGLAILMVPSATLMPQAAVPILFASQALVGMGIVVANVNAISLRQAITPDHLQGRVNATSRFITWGVSPIGALIGGLLGESVGLSATLVVAGLGYFLGFPWLFFSPVRCLREQPTPDWRPL